MEMSRLNTYIHSMYYIQTDRHTCEYRARILWNVNRIRNNDLKLKTHFLHPVKAIQANQALSGPLICSKLCDCFELISPFAPFCTSGSKCVLLRYGQYGTTNNHGVPPYRGQCFISTPMFSRPRTPHVSWTWTQFGQRQICSLLSHRLFDQLNVTYFLGETIFSGTHSWSLKYWSRHNIFSFERFLNFHISRCNLLMGERKT